MNLLYIIGIALAFLLCVFGMVTSIAPIEGAESVAIQIGEAITIDFSNVINFFDPSSILIVIGCTIAVVLASFPVGMIKSIGKHFKIIMDTKRNDPRQYIELLVEFAQIARKNGLLSLEEKANEQSDPFFKHAIMLIVDANDPDKVRSILTNDIECMSTRHEEAAAMYEKASAVAPAFGMIGTLVGLINMLKRMNLDSGSSTIGSDMGTALITTLYGCILAHMIFGPIATNLRNRDSEEVLCKTLIVEGIMAIQSGENPKFLRERLETFLTQKMRSDEDGAPAAGGKGGKKGKKGAPAEEK